MDTQTRSIQSDMKTWINDSFALPNWVKEHMQGQAEANGTFVIDTPMGSARVHRGFAVVEHQGAAYTCESDETDDLIRRLHAEETITPRIPVGPGKRLDRSGASPLKKRKSPQKRGTIYSKPLGSPPSIEWLPIERLSVDASYQRSIDNVASHRLITSIAVNFDWRLCTPLVVSRRPNGDLIVIDGQHRTTAARRRADIPHLPCCIFNYAGPEEEARMFIAANRARKPMNRLDDFHAALAAMDEDALEIQSLVTEAGLTMARNTSSTAWRPKEIAFTATIASSIRKYGSAVVSAALTNMAEAFPDERLTHGGSIFLALAKIFNRPPEGFDPDKLFEVLKRRSAAQWGQIVTGLRGGDMRASAIRDVMLSSYEEEIVPSA